MKYENFFIMSLLLLLSMSPLFSEIIIESETIENGWSVKIENKSDLLYKVMLISSNPDYLADRGQVTVEVDSSIIVNINMNDNKKPESAAAYLLIRLISDHPDNPQLINLGNNGDQIIKISDSLAENDNNTLLEYYYSPSCHSCREFLKREIPRLEKKLQIEIDLKEINITEPAGLIVMNNKLKQLNSSEIKLPIVIIGDQVLAGDKNIEADLEGVLSGLIIKSEKEDSGELSLSLLPIITAGLIDGINPCAFSTLLFLLSWLTLAGRNRKEILITGIFFTIAVFTSYYLVGLGAFTVLQSSRSVPLISVLLKYFMAIIMLVLAVIHIVDYRKILQGKTSEITLQLSKERKKKIHSIIRGRIRQTGLFAGSLILGIAVTIYELGCTGQIYLPTLMYMVRIEKEVSSFLLLAIYNLGFILPLIILFFAAWKGTASEKLTLWFTGNLKKVKLL